jgi:hypothetical protein
VSAGWASPSSRGLWVGDGLHALETEPGLRFELCALCSVLAVAGPPGFEECAHAPVGVDAAHRPGARQPRIAHPHQRRPSRRRCCARSTVCGDALTTASGPTTASVSDRKAARVCTSSRRLVRLHPLHPFRRPIDTYPLHARRSHLGAVHCASSLYPHGSDGGCVWCVCVAIQVLNTHVACSLRGSRPLSRACSFARARDVMVRLRAEPPYTLPF